MALDVEKILADALLEKSKTKSLEKITIRDLQEMTGVSRQTFYNHFKDLADLLQYIYRERVVVHWDPTDVELDFCDYLIKDLTLTHQYRNFLASAVSMNGQNNLREYMIDYCVQFDLQWMRSFYGGELPESIVRTVIYQSTGSMELKIRWFTGRLDCSLYDLAESIINNRGAGLGPLMWPGRADTPYTRAAAKIGKIRKARERR